MSDLRLDPITGQWVAIAANRRHRPNEFQQVLERAQASHCPFCVGNESETPQPLQVVTTSGGEEWVVRVVPNKFPSFPKNGSPSCPDSPVEFGPYSQFPAAGIQEVIIHSPRHVESLSELSERELYQGFEVFADRVKFVSSQSEIEHAMLFKNCRAEAGASLQHVHSQLIGTPLVPDQLRLRWQRMKTHLEQNNRSILESIVDWELAREVRVLEATDRFAVICPFASRFGYQLWIVPRQQSTRFVDLDQQSNRELALLCQRYIGRLEQQLDNPAYNLLFHFAPREFADYEHWFVELFPRLTRPAGFEWGTGWWVNPYAPEDVASNLRRN